MEEAFRHRGYDKSVEFVASEGERLFAYGDNTELLEACERAVAALQVAMRQDPWTRSIVSAGGFSNAVFLIQFAEVYARAGRGFSFN